MMQKSDKSLKEIKKLKRLLIIITILAVLIISGIFITNYVTKKYIYPLKYIDTVDKISSEYGLDKYLIMAVIKAESSFNEKAVSSQNAKGLMQLLDNTAEYISGTDKKDIDLFDPSTNIELGVKYIDRLMKTFDGDLNLVLIAYNAGEGNTKKWIEQGIIDPKDSSTFENIPYIETKTYLKKIEKNYIIYKTIYNK